jgi:hypothetical protein
MLKTAVVGTGLLLFSSLCLADDKLPPGAIEKGTLANVQLIRDAKMGVAAEVAVMGCDKPGDIDPYVLAMPSGSVGARMWKELWIVSGCGKKYPVKIDFQEDGANAANWSISK